MEDIEITRIGSITIDVDDTDVIEEKVIGKVRLKRYGELIIEVYSKEGDYIPHFHFYTKDKKIDGCMQIFNPDYFIHGNHKSMLTNRQLKQLINFLNDERYESVNNWRLIVFAWIGENYDEQTKIAKKLKIKNYKDPSNTINMPDYSKLLK